MKIIAHRGNLYGPFSDNPNHPETIIKAWDMGFDVELDLRYYPDEDSEYMSGHDEGVYPINVAGLEPLKTWIHCKDIITFLHIQENYRNYNCFFHDVDVMTLTTSNHIWCHPKILLTLYEYHRYNDPLDFSNCIAVLPEFLWSTKTHDEIDEKSFLKKFYGICTDYPLTYRKLLVED